MADSPLALMMSHKFSSTSFHIHKYILGHLVIFSISAGVIVHLLFFKVTKILYRKQRNSNLELTKHKDAQTVLDVCSALTALDSFTDGFHQIPQSLLVHVECGFRTLHTSQIA